MNLTPKQEAFAQNIASGMTQADAYRSAYDAGKMKDATVWHNASKLMANNKVATRVSEIRKPLEDRQLWTREMSVKALITAYREGAASVKVSAVKELNAMHGFNVPTKIDLNGNLAIAITREIVRASQD
jgi:phage terminase small subunit